MRVRRVYIKRSGGEIATEACYIAWRGFSHLGYPLDFFEWEDLADKSLRLDRRTLIVGGTVSVHEALRQIGVEIPPPLNLPKPLLEFAGRRVWTPTLGEVRQQFDAAPSGALFIKPLVETKSFAGCVVTGAKELDRLRHLNDSLELQASEPVEFISEWRYYVHRGDVVGVAKYNGDWSTVPESTMVRDALSRYVGCPAAYCLDFGVTRDRRTLLVEANDAFALGAQGIDAVAYAKMLEDRWLEITCADEASD
jgi:hypothetical protein